MKYIKSKVAPWRQVALFVFTAILATAASSYAQDMKDVKDMSMKMDKSPKATTIQGEVIDMACYMTKGQHGADHADCAQMCINNGLPVGILDKSGHVYLCMTSTQKPANSLLVQYAAKQVKVTGTVYKKGGMDMLAVDKVEPLDKDIGTK
jgi:hypothetical protein